MEIYPIRFSSFFESVLFSDIAKRVYETHGAILFAISDESGVLINPKGFQLLMNYRICFERWRNRICYHDKTGFYFLMHRMLPMQFYRLEKMVPIIITQPVRYYQ